MQRPVWNNSAVPISAPAEGSASDRRGRDAAGDGAGEGEEQHEERRGKKRGREEEARPEGLSVEEEAELRRFYEGKIQEVCAAFRFPHKIYVSHNRAGFRRLKSSRIRSA